MDTSWLTTALAIAGFGLGILNYRQGVARDKREQRRDMQAVEDAKQRVTLTADVNVRGMPFEAYLEVTVINNGKALVRVDSISAETSKPGVRFLLDQNQMMPRDKLGHKSVFRQSLLPWLVPEAVEDALVVELTTTLGAKFSVETEMIYFPQLYRGFRRHVGAVASPGL